MNFSKKTRLIEGSPIDSGRYYLYIVYDVLYVVKCICTIKSYVSLVAEKRPDSMLGAHVMFEAVLILGAEFTLITLVFIVWLI